MSLLASILAGYAIGCLGFGIVLSVLGAMVDG